MEKSPKKTKTWVIKCQGDIDEALKIIEDYIASIPDFPNRYTRKLKNKRVYNIEQLPCNSKGNKRYVPPPGSEDNEGDNYYLFSFKGRESVITRSYFYKIWGDLDVKPAFVYREEILKEEEKEEVPKEDDEVYDILRKMRKLNEVREKMERAYKEFNELFEDVVPGAISLLEKVSKEGQGKGKESAVSTQLWSSGNVRSEEEKSCSQQSNEEEENSVLFKAEVEF